MKRPVLMYLQFIYHQSAAEIMSYSHITLISW